MRLLELYLQAFGPFTDVGLDLSGGDRGLHVVYGANEAGKSSTLRALKALFYGIPAQSTDNFQHSYARLRVGARITDEDENELTFFRRKGHKNTLLDPDENPLPQTQLERYLANVSERLFSNLLGIGHQELVDGGREMLERRGDLAESLFAAALGGARLRNTLKSLELEMEHLFKKQGQKPLINQAIASFRALRKEISSASLSAGDWKARKESLESAQKDADRLNAEVGRLHNEQNRLQRVQRALPLVAKRREFEEKLAALGPFPRLRASFPQERREAEGLRDHALSAEKALRVEVESLEEKLIGMSDPGEILAHEKVIHDLYLRMGSFNKARQDLGKLKELLEAKKGDAADLARELRPGKTLEEVQDLRLGDIEENSIRTLANEYSSRFKEVESRHAEVSDLGSEVKGLEEELSRKTQPPAADATKALRSITQMVPGDLEDQLESTRKNFESATQECAIELRGLSLWRGSLEELEALAVPTTETVDRFDSDLTRVDSEVARLEREGLETSGRVAGLTRELDELEREGSVPSEKALEDVRGHRDAGWGMVLRAWIDGETDSIEANAFAAGKTLAEAYEESVRQADEVADRLRMEADRVARRTRLTGGLDEANESLRAQGVALEKKRLERDALLDAWTDAWADNPASGLRALGVPSEPDSKLRSGGLPLPREMRAWLTDRAQLLKGARSLREKRAQVEELENRVGRCRRELAQALEQIDSDAGSGSLRSVLSRCHARVQEVEEMEQNRVQLEGDLRLRRMNLSKARAKLDGLVAEQNALGVRWKEAVGSLDLGPRATPELANEVLGKLRRLFSAADEADRLRVRIDAIESDSKEFSSEVLGFVMRVSPDLKSLPPQEAVGTLHARFSNAREVAGARREAEERLEERKARLVETVGALERARITLGSLCKESGCENSAQLLERETLWDEGSKIAEEISRIEDQLRAEAAGETLEEFVTRVNEVDGEALPGLIGSLKASLLEQGETLARIHQDIGKHQVELDQMDGGSRAADASLQAESCLAEIREAAERYARLRLAWKILQRQIDRYRSENQAPLLRRAGELFRNITLESFIDLRAAFDDKDRPVIEAVRSSKDVVGVEGMSSGTRDQLYLALRLASLERHLETHAPMPFIVDDLLINFDDGRSQATLEVLAELSSRTQVIFFTHNQHLVDLARRVTPGDVLRAPSYVPLEALEGWKAHAEGPPTSR